MNFPRYQTVSISVHDHQERYPMSGGARLDAPGTLHHVMLRGIERGNIVYDGRRMFPAENEHNRLIS
jgi:hypothetical protein